MTSSFKDVFRLKPIEYLACIVAIGAIALAGQQGSSLGSSSAVSNESFAQRASPGIPDSPLVTNHPLSIDNSLGTSSAQRGVSGMPGSFVDGAQDPAENSPIDSPPVLQPSLESGAQDSSPISALDASPHFWLPPAATMEELIAGADAILIGTVLEVLREANEGPYGPNGELQSPRTMDVVGQGGQVLQHPGLDVTYFEVRIEEILLNDGRLASGGSFELRLIGHASQPQSEAESIKPLPDAGQRTLFVMGVNPDFRSYGTGLWGEIDLSGDQPRYRDWDQTPVVFAEGRSPEAFLDNLRAAIGERDG